MLSSTQTLRSATSSSVRQPSLMASYASLSAPARSQDTRSPQCKTRPQGSSRAAAQSSLQKQCLARPLSTSVPPAASTVSSQKTAASGDMLDWNSFFKMRKSRRYWQLGSSVGTSIFGVTTGIQVLTAADVEPFINQIPLDPFVTLGLMTFSCGALGWLTGPIVGTGIFNMINSKYKTEMAQKEKEFYSRIKKYRVDPSASSMANPVPDYYGEKIGSVAGYRQWLKDQRAFNKKRQTYI